MLNLYNIFFKILTITSVDVDETYIENVGEIGGKEEFDKYIGDIENIKPSFLENGAELFFITTILLLLITLLLCFIIYKKNKKLKELYNRIYEDNQ